MVLGDKYLRFGALIYKKKPIIGCYVVSNICKCFALANIIFLLAIIQIEFNTLMNFMLQIQILQ